MLQVRSLAESTGEVETATPSLAVQMVGLNSVPTAGDEFYVCADETMARKAAEVAEDAQVSRLLLVLSTARWPLFAMVALCCCCSTSHNCLLSISSSAFRVRL